MKRLLIYDVAAESGGGYEILKKYYEYYLNNHSYYCLFVTSVAGFKNSDHLQNIVLPWIKKSWFHRLYCDRVYIKRIIKKYEIDEVFSLQNIAIKTNLKQTVYVQNVIPYSDYKFCLFSEFNLWAQKHLIGFLARRSLRYADKIVVQSNWMKNEVSSQLKISLDKIIVEKVDIYISCIESRLLDTSDKVTFFYPAAPLPYKNHMSIINACKRMIECGKKNFEFVFTMDGKENRFAKRMKRMIQDYELPIKLVGYLNKERVYDYYRKSVLVFPSLLETVGIPLLEAKAFGCNIISIDMQYSRETIGEYNNCLFYDSKDENGLFNLVNKIVKK